MFLRGGRAMELENLLKELIKNEEVKLKKYVLFMVLKFSHLVKEVEKNKEYLPLLLIQNNRIILIYKDKNLDNLEYTFSDYEEILVILKKHFNDGKSIYFHYETPHELLTKEEIMNKINEAIVKNNEELFRYYASKLKQ